MVFSCSDIPNICSPPAATYRLESSKSSPLPFHTRHCGAEPENIRYLHKMMYDSQAGQIRVLHQDRQHLLRGSRLFRCCLKFTN